MPNKANAMAVLLLLLGPAVGRAQPARDFGAARFTPPPGWTLETQPTLQTMTLIRGNNLCVVAIYGDEPSPRPLEAAFAQAWTNVFSRGYRSAPRPSPRAQVSPAGYQHLAGEGEIIDNQNNRFIARLYVFPAGAKTQTIAWIGNSPAALESCRPDWEGFFAALRFPAVATVVATEPGRGAAGGAAERPASPSRGRGASPVGPMTFENVTFVAPAGWSVERTPGAIHLAPTDARREEVLRVSLLPGRVSSASLTQEFDRGWSEVATALNAQLMRSVNGGAYDLDEPGRSMLGWEYVRGTGGMRLADGQYTVTLYAIRAGARVERVVAVAKDFRDNLTTASASMNPRYERAIREFVFTLQFANVPARPVAPTRLSGSGITGVWAGMAMSFGSIKTQFAIFFDNGIVYFGPGFPTYGLLGIDASIDQPARPRYWGTYVTRTGGAVITMPYGTIPVRVNGSALELTTTGTSHRFVRLSMPTGSLEGNWCLSDGRCLQLQAGGRFQDSGAARVLEHATYPFPETPAQGAGQFELRDHTLVLRYDAGPEIRIAFPGLADNPSVTPRELMVGFNLDMLTRQARESP